MRANAKVSGDKLPPRMNKGFALRKVERLWQFEMEKAF